MAFVTTEDGAEIYYKDWGSRDAQPIMFHHGWPLSADDWDAQMLFFLEHGYRVIASDRRGHGRSIADRHRPRHGPLRQRRLRRRRAPRPAERDPHRPLHRRRPGRPLRRPVRRAAGPRRQGRPRLVRAPAHGEDRREPRRHAHRASSTGSAARSPRTAPSSTRPSRPAPSTASTATARRSPQPVIDNWWRQGMTGSALAHYEGIKAFSETDQTDDLKAITVPVLVTAGRRRPGRSLQGRVAEAARAAAELHAQDLRGLPARHADDARRRDQPRPAGVHPAVVAALRFVRRRTRGEPRVRRLRSQRQ